MPLLLASYNSYNNSLVMAAMKQLRSWLRLDKNQDSYYYELQQAMLMIPQSSMQLFQHFVAIS